MDALRDNPAVSPAKAADEEWKFSDILAVPGIRDRWEKVRQYFFLRESTYDMTNRCNIRCDGCYYYENEIRYNWAEEWCERNPGECDACGCAHSHCLNCQQKGKAFWWMMARMAGWDGTAGHTCS